MAIVITPGILLSAILDGLAYGMVIFLIASGLAIIFGLMDILNFAHATFFMLGAYITIHFVTYIMKDFILAILITTIIGFGLGILVEVVLLRPLYGKPASQMLLTLGLMLLLLQVVTLFWPAGLVFPIHSYIFVGTIDLIGTRIYVYRLVIILIGFGIMLLLDLFLTKTTFGAKIRAGTENRELAQVFGINIKLIFTFAFALGTAMAFFGGAIASPWLNATVEIGTNFTLLSFVVVVIGGMKSHRGTFFSSILIGIIHQLSAYFLPAITLVIDLLIMIVVLLIKPEGIFGSKE